MVTFRNERHKQIAIISVTGILSILLMICTVIQYAHSEYTRTIRQAGREISDITLRSAQSIDAYVQSAQSHIKNASIGLSNLMVDSYIANPEEVLPSYIENAPFSDIEYIRADGMNMTKAGEPFDASDREYFKQGILGKTGTWINFSPRYSDEPLLNFYTPLMRNNRIVGVLTGTIGGNIAMETILFSDYLGQLAIGIIVDENNTVIASTVPFQKGVVLNESAENIIPDILPTFLTAIERADGVPVTLGSQYDSTLCVVQESSSTHWKVIQLLPADSIQALTHVERVAAVQTATVILFISVFFFLVVILSVRKLARMTLHQVESERDEQIRVVLSMSDMYYSMHLVDLQTDTVISEYKAQNQVKDIVARGESASKTMQDVVRATITEAHMATALEFTDLGTLAERMRGRKFSYQDLLGMHVGWIRFCFITIEADDEQRPVRLVVTTQVIDEEKKREQELLQKSNYDELTGLMNKRACLERMQEIGSGPKNEDLVYLSMDVNGLKVVNDTLGHLAGDELIRGAAACMSRHLKPYGGVYRTGGDEFIAILEIDPDQLQPLLARFQASVDRWRGQLSDKLAVSIGCAPWRDFMDLSFAELAKTADQRMYQAKAAYYQRKGVDRRGLASAQTALLSLYNKILKINLTTDTHTVVSMDKSEMTAEQGYSEKISEWLRQFAFSGNIHEEDLAYYLKKTDTAFLKAHFMQGKRSISIRYRRRIGDAFRNVVMTMICADDYSPENQSLFLYVQDVEL